MARQRNALPTVDFESTGNRARAAGGGGSSGSGGFNNRTVSDFSAGIAGLNDMVQRIQFERDTVKAVGEESRITTETAAAQSKLNPLDKDYQKQVADLWSGAKKQVMESGITSTAVLDDISKRMDRHSASMQVAAIGETKTATSKKAELTYKDAVDAQNAKIRNDPSNANLYMDEFKADAERLKIGMDPLAFEVVSRKAADEFAKNQIIGYAEKGNYGAARNALKAQAPHLDTGVVTGLSNYVDGKESKARADNERAQTANIANVLVDINDKAHGNKPWSGNERDVLDDMKKRGAISPAGYLTAVSNLNSAQDKFKVEAQKDAIAVEHVNNGTVPDQTTANRGFRALFGGIPFGQIAMQGTAEQRAQGILVAAGMASGTGFLPADMKNLIENADKITDPKRANAAAYAAEAMDEFDVRAPNKINGLALSDTGVVARTRTEAKRLMADGVPKQEAYLAAAQTSMPKDSVTIQQEADLKARFKEENKTTNFPSAALNAVSDIFQRNVPFMAPEASATMSAEYKRVYEQAYIDTRGDKDRAKALADARMKQDYGVTKIGVTDARQTEAAPGTGMDEFGIAPAYTGGVPGTVTGMAGGGKATVQKHPPERYMKTFFPQMSDDQLAKMVMADLDAFNAKEKIAPAPSKDTTGRAPVYLAPDATTEADLRAGRPPSYEYRLLKGDIYEPIMSATTGKPVRYRIPSSPDQVKGNPVFLEAETARRTQTEKAINLDIELKKAVPDPVADDRAKRMIQEGKKKQRAQGDTPEEGSAEERRRKAKKGN